MGYLTTVTFRNNDYEAIKNDMELNYKIANAMDGVQIENGYDFESSGNSANAMILQKPRHADDTTLYLHAGNTVVDVSNAHSEWAVDQFIHEMEYHLKRLKNLQKEIKKLKSLKEIEK